MTRFKRRPETEESIFQIYNQVKDLDYGVSLNWDKLEKMSGYVMSRERLYDVVDAVNRLLMSKHQKYMETIIGEGKRIVLPNEHSLAARKKVKESARIYRKAGLILASTNMNMLTNDEKEQIIRDSNRWRTLELVHNELINKRTLSKEKTNQNIIKDVVELLNE